MSHALVLTAEIGDLGLWTVSRGLARGLSDYKRMIDLADSPHRENAMDVGICAKRHLRHSVNGFHR